MHLTQSLVNGTLAEAAQALAERAVAIQYGAPRLSPAVLEKTAFLQNMNPTARNALIGAGVGGALGLGSSMLQDPEERNIGGSMLTGAMAGGATGLGIGLASQNSPAKALAPKLDAQGRPVLGRGQFYHPQTGKPMAISSDLPPEIAAKMTNLDQQANGRTLAGSVWEGAGKLGYNAATGVPVTAGATAGLIYKNMSQPSSGTGYPSKLFGKGGWNVDPMDSRNVSHLSKGIRGLDNKDLADISMTTDERTALGNMMRDRAGLKQTALHATPYTSNGVTLDEKILGPLRRRGAELEIPKSSFEAGAVPHLRSSFLHRLTGGRLAEPHVNMSSRWGALRTAGKYLGGAVGAGFLERGLYDNLNQRSAKNEVQKLLEQYAKPLDQ